MIGVGRNSVYNLLNSKALASDKIGGRRLVLVADLRALFKRGE
jgi:hypothetical protein